jgi:hypothetical protein
MEKWIKQIPGNEYGAIDNVSLLFERGCLH